MISGKWYQRKTSFKNWPKLHKITNNSMRNRGSNPLLTNLVSIKPRNAH